MFGSWGISEFLSALGMVKRQMFYREDFINTRKTTGVEEISRPVRVSQERGTLGKRGAQLNYKAEGIRRTVVRQDTRGAVGLESSPPGSA